MSIPSSTRWSHGALVQSTVALLLSLAWLVLATTAGLAQEVVSEMEVLDERAGTGEQCIVCGQQIKGDMVVEVRYKGRTFHIAKDMVPTFEADPETYFRSIQARGGLFDEEALTEMGHQGSNGWLYFGIYVLVGLVFAAIASYLAIARSRAPLPWFFAGLFLNLIGLAWLLLSPKGIASAASPYGVPSGLRKVPSTTPPSSCSRCGAAHHPAAQRCAVCGTELTPTIEAETARA